MKSERNLFFLGHRKIVCIFFSTGERSGVRGGGKGGGFYKDGVLHGAHKQTDKRGRTDGQGGRGGVGGRKEEGSRGGNGVGGEE